MEVSWVFSMHIIYLLVVYYAHNGSSQMNFLHFILGVANFNTGQNLHQVHWRQSEIELNYAQPIDISLLMIYLLIDSNVYVWILEFLDVLLSVSY